jgi:hypothetical protein
LVCRQKNIPSQVLLQGMLVRLPWCSPLVIDLAEYLPKALLIAILANNRENSPLP